MSTCSPAPKSPEAEASAEKITMDPNGKSTDPNGKSTDPNGKSTDANRTSGEANRTPEETPQMISALDIHYHLVKLHRMGNMVRKEFMDGLLRVYEGNLMGQLCCSTITQYAFKFFRLSGSATYAFMKVGSYLRDLLLLAEAFELGELSYSDLRELVRLELEGLKKYEKEWLECAKSSSFNKLKKEVEYALKKKRKKPRKDRYGLPNLNTRVTYEFSPEEYECYTKGLEKVMREASESLEPTPSGRRPRVEPTVALLYMCERFLETEPVGTPAGRQEKKESPIGIYFSRCYDCQKTLLTTAEGPVETDGSFVDLVLEEAEKVYVKPEELEPVIESNSEPEEESEEEPKEVPPSERDKPNSPALTKKVDFRDGGVCANPHCGRRLGRHAHHIKWRSHGGKSVLANEISVCSLCHSLVHQRVLKIEGNPLDGLTWTTPLDKVHVDFTEELKTLASLGVGTTLSPPPAAAADEGESPIGDSGEAKAQSPIGDSGAPRAQSPIGDSDAEDLILDAASALRTLGSDRKEAIERAKKAYEVLVERLGRQPTLEELLSESFRVRIRMVYS